MFHEGTLLPFSLEQTDGIFAIFLVCLLVFTNLYNNGLMFLSENVRLLIYSSLDHRGHEQTTIKEIIYNYFLVFQFVVLTALSLYIIFMEYQPTAYHDSMASHSMLIILVFMVVMFLFIFIKCRIYQFIGFLFNMQSVLTGWKNTFLMLLEILGILFFIPSLVLVYSHSFHIFFIVVMLILFTAIQIVFFSQIIIFFVREKFNCLYLIVYLCTVEILPYIFLFSGLYYLYKIDILNLL